MPIPWPMYSSTIPYAVGSDADVVLDRGRDVAAVPPSRAAAMPCHMASPVARSARALGGLLPAPTTVTPSRRASRPRSPRSRSTRCHRRPAPGTRDAVDDLGVHRDAHVGREAVVAQERGVAPEVPDHLGGHGVELRSRDAGPDRTRVACSVSATTSPARRMPIDLLGRLELDPTATRRFRRVPDQLRAPGAPWRLVQRAEHPLGDLVDLPQTVDPDQQTARGVDLEQRRGLVGVDVLPDAGWSPRCRRHGPRSRPASAAGRRPRPRRRSATRTTSSGVPRSSMRVEVSTCARVRG